MCLCSPCPSRRCRESAGKLRHPHPGPLSEGEGDVATMFRYDIIMVSRSATSSTRICSKRNRHGNRDRSPRKGKFPTPARS